jgi:hypothetical protein
LFGFSASTITSATTKDTFLNVVGFGVLTGCGYEEFCLLGYNALLAAYLMLVSCFAYFSILKMKTCSSETSTDLYWATWLYIPDDRTRFQTLLLHVSLTPYDLLFFALSTQSECIQVR